MKNTRLALWLSLIFYWLFTFFLLFVVVKNMNGHFGYPLDDTYIHMAIGKYFAKEGFWGVALNGFSSSTSSPLWTFLISIIYKIVGVNIWAPLGLAVLFGTMTIYFCYFVLRDYINSIRLLLVLIILILFIPLPVLTLTGMEHVLHSFVSSLLLYCGATYLSKNRFNFTLFILLVVLANLTTIVRYEGLFLVFSIVLFFFLKMRFKEGVLFGVSSLFLIAIYGFIALANNWYFFPNSILLKGNTPSLALGGLSVFVNRILMNFYSSPHILVLLLCCLIVYLWSGKRLGIKEKYLIVLAVLITLLHMLFADTGWFFRYEAYLVLSLSLVLLDTFHKLANQQEVKFNKKNLDNLIVGLLLLILICIPLATRSGLALQDYSVAVKNIYEQQYQMGLFVQKYYAGRYVVAHDIGAINYLSNIYIIDFYGLANMDVAHHRLNGSFSKEIIEQLVSAHDVPLIIIYDDWFVGRIPDNWIAVGRWKIADNLVCDSDEVTFYATNESDKQELIKNLIDFSETLPSSVKQSGIYLFP